MFKTIDQVIDEIVADDPGFLDTLRQARIELAPLLYPEGGEQYERMMRGDPPPRADNQE